MRGRGKILSFYSYTPLYKKGIKKTQNKYLFPLCHFLNGALAPMKLDNKLILHKKANLYFVLIY